MIGILVPTIAGVPIIAGRTVKGSLIMLASFEKSAFSRGSMCLTNFEIEISMPPDIAFNALSATEERL